MFKCNCKKVFKTQRGLSIHGKKCLLFTNDLKANKKKSIYINEEKNIYICECKKEFEKYQSLNAHFSHCLIHRKGKEPIKIGRYGWRWNNGRSLEEIFGKEKAQQYREKLSKSSTKWRTGKKLSKKHKESISKGRIKYLEKHGNHGVEWYEVFNGKKIIKVQGRWEKKVAEILTSKNIYWERKRLKFSKNRIYTIDFFLPESNTYIEVKGWMRDRDIYKLNKVLEDNKIDLKLIEKEEFKNIENINIKQLPKFKEKYKDYEINYSLFKIKY